MGLAVYRGAGFDSGSDESLRIHAPLVRKWLVEFLRAECIRRRGMRKVVLGLSGGVDSAVVAYLCAEAFGAENVLAVRLPYRVSTPESLEHAQLVIDALGLESRTIDITSMAESYVATEPDITPLRLGNVCARCRMTILFDQAAKIGGLPIGTGNKSERLFGYFTWHGDDAPPINPLGDLFKTQVWQLAEHIGVPAAIIEKPASAELERGQTTEGDLGITYRKADRILHYLTTGYSKDKLIDLGFPKEEVAIVWNRVAKTHWKRRPPTVAMLSTGSIGEYYLRPVDY